MKEKINDNTCLLFSILCTDELIKLFPGFSHLCIQAMAGTLGGFTTTIITNPLDIVRARLQVQRLNSMFGVFEILWVEEGLHMFTKGLSARLVQSACFSCTIILGYETIKRMSIIDEYKSYVRW
jgi:solute carrier family 25 protein 44